MVFIEGLPPNANDWSDLDLMMVSWSKPLTRAFGMVVLYYGKTSWMTVCTDIKSSICWCFQFSNLFMSFVLVPSWSFCIVSLFHKFLLCAALQMTSGTRGASLVGMCVGTSSPKVMLINISSFYVKEILHTLMFSVLTYETVLYFLEVDLLVNYDIWHCLFLFLFFFR